MTTNHSRQWKSNL